MSVWSSPKLFTKVISRWQYSPLAGKKLGLSQLRSCNVHHIWYRNFTDHVCVNIIGSYLSPWPLLSCLLPFYGSIIFLDLHKKIFYCWKKKIRVWRKRWKGLMRKWLKWPGQTWKMRYAWSGSYFTLCIHNNWAATWDFQQCGMCDQQSIRSACAYAQSDQSFC